MLILLPSFIEALSCQDYLFAKCLQIFCLTLFVALTEANVDYIRYQTEYLTPEPLTELGHLSVFSQFNILSSSRVSQN